MVYFLNAENGKIYKRKDSNDRRKTCLKKTTQTVPHRS
jgi:hypothetical protein